MADQNTEQLEAAERANTAVNEPRDPGKVRSSIKAAAAAARAAIPAGGGKLNEPAITSAGSAVAPRDGAAVDSGQAPKAPAIPANAEQTVILADDEEYEALQKQTQGKAAAPAAGAEGEVDQAPAEEVRPEGEQAAEGEAAGEGDEAGGEQWIPVRIPGASPDAAALEVDVEDPALATEIQRLARSYVSRSQLAVVQEEVNAGREEQAQLEDHLTVDPVGFLSERVRPELKVSVARALMSDPQVFNAIAEEFGGLEGEALKQKSLEIRNEILERRQNVQRTLSERSTDRTQGRKIDTAIRQIIPDEMDQPTATRLYNDMRRDIAEYITQNRGKAVPISELPDILQWRLQHYGITPDYAAERLQDAGFPPLPARARAARADSANGNGRQRSPVRTGEQVVQQADRRRAAAAVPGGGAGVPAQGAWVVPKKGLGVKGIVAALREVTGLGK